jgi:hypothetical protein
MMFSSVERPQLKVATRCDKQCPAPQSVHFFSTIASFKTVFAVRRQASSWATVSTPVLTSKNPALLRYAEQNSFPRRIYPFSDWLYDLFVSQR